MWIKVDGLIMLRAVVNSTQDAALSIIILAAKNVSVDILKFNYQSNRCSKRVG